ncbi:LRC42 protein, partial [Amia calva]|nr:LRC42 protein [Amia calva]
MCSYRRSYEECGPVYVREKGELRRVSEALNTEDGPLPSRVKPLRLFQKGFSVQLCVSDRAQTTSPRKDHFIFTYTKEGSLRYSPKSLLNIALKFIAENVQHIDSLIGFPEQMAERLFTAAEEKHTFSDPKTGVKALQTFSEAYGNLVLNSLCLRSRFLLVSEKLEEIKAFSGLRSLDLSCCKLGDDHELLEHLTSEALSSLVHLSLGDNCLSDSGLRKLTAPVRVMKRGLGNLQRLDLSCNPMICAHGIGYLSCFSKLQSLDLSATGVKVMRLIKSMYTLNKPFVVRIKKVDEITDLQV